MSANDELDAIAEELAEAIADAAIASSMDELMTAPDFREETRILREAVEREFERYTKPLEKKRYAELELVLPPLKPTPKVNPAELAAIKERCSDPAEQDRLAKEFIQQLKKGDE